MKGFFLMAKTDPGNPHTATIRGGLDCGILAMKYLQEYNGALLHKPSPVDITDFVVNYLQLGVISAAIDLPFIKAFIVYVQMLYSDAVSNCPIFVNPGTIILNENVVIDSPEGRFILAHEAGHWIINRERTPRTQAYYSCCKSFAERTDFLDIHKMEHYYANDPDAWEEVMADNVANALLMPASSFYMYSAELMDQFGFVDHRIFIGEHPEEENMVITILASAFDVPKYAVRNRLYTLGLYARC